MTPYQILILMFTPLWAALIHSSSSRLARAKRQQAAIWSCCLSALVTVVVLSLTATPANATGTFFVFSWFNSVLLAHVYFHIFNMSETARRIKLLEAIRTGEQQSQSSLYTAEALVSIRLERLLALAKIRVEGGRYFAASSWLVSAAAFLTAYESLLFPRRRRGGKAISGWNRLADSSSREPG